MDSSNPMASALQMLFSTCNEGEPSQSKMIATKRRKVRAENDVDSSGHAPQLPDSILKTMFVWIGKLPNSDDGYTKKDSHSFECILCKSRLIIQPSSGYGNLYRHARSQHTKEIEASEQRPDRLKTGTHIIGGEHEPLQFQSVQQMPDQVDALALLSAFNSCPVAEICSLSPFNMYHLLCKVLSRNRFMPMPDEFTVAKRQSDIAEQLQSTCHAALASCVGFVSHCDISGDSCLGISVEFVNSDFNRVRFTADLIQNLNSQPVEKLNKDLRMCIQNCKSKVKSGNALWRPSLILQMANKCYTVRKSPPEPMKDIVEQQRNSFEFYMDEAEYEAIKSLLTDESDLPPIQENKICDALDATALTSYSRTVWQGDTAQLAVMAFKGPIKRSRQALRVICSIRNFIMCLREDEAWRNSPQGTAITQVIMDQEVRWENLANVLLKFDEIYELCIEAELEDPTLPKLPVVPDSYVVDGRVLRSIIATVHEFIRSIETCDAHCGAILIAIEHVRNTLMSEEWKTSFLVLRSEIASQLQISFQQHRSSKLLQLAAYLDPGTYHLSGLTRLEALSLIKNLPLPMTSSSDNQTVSPGRTQLKVFVKPAARTGSSIETQLAEFEAAAAGFPPPSSMAELFQCERAFVFWRNRRQILPHLAAAAQYVFSIPASSAETEHMISTISHQKISRRTDLSPDTLKRFAMIRRNFTYLAQCNLLPFQWGKFMSDLLKNTQTSSS